jgi:hypothetical protein
MPSRLVHGLPGRVQLFTVLVAQTGLNVSGLMRFSQPTVSPDH